MIVRFSEVKNNDKIGNKAKSLVEMKKAGFNVPDGFIIDTDTYLEEIKYNKIDSKIDSLLKKINKENINEISKDIIELFDTFSFRDETIKKIHEYANKDMLYAVRSSGSKEDLDNFSFAGQYDTFLNVNINILEERIIDCYKSMFSEIILSYFVNNNIPFKDFSMSVIVEEMVDSEYSGICFTINPITGNDKEMLIEVGKGLGENIVSGKNKPEQYYYDWYEDRLHYSKNNKLINGEIIKNIVPTLADIGHFYGYPCDIEFAIQNNELYILQARKIKKVKYESFKYIWSTADFKDGGVSQSVCTPYMWSLYEYIWEYTLRKFIIDSKILKPKEIPDTLGDMFYGRPYWNLSCVKNAMSQVIGYKERDFDNEYGITPTYEGDGKTTKANLKSLIAIIKMAIAQNKIVKTREENKEFLKKDLLEKYYKYKDMYDRNKIHDISEVWRELTYVDYLYSESTYFWQIFINTIHQSLKKDKILIYTEEEDYLTLLGNIDNISHLLPFYEMWDVSRKIRDDKEINTYWTKTSVEDIVSDLKRIKKKYAFEEVNEIIDKYGYHSDKELDVTYPCYYEDPTPIISNIKDLVNLSDEFSPIKDNEIGKKKYNDKLAEIKNKIGVGNYEDLEKMIVKIRDMLWWREEFRDISTRFYYLIRVYTIKYAEYLVNEKVLDKIDDVWFLKVGDLWNYQDGIINKDRLNKIIKKNRYYYECYRNYMSENEIGQVFSENKIVKSSLKGLGANNGIVTGVARVIESFDEIDRLKENDILVTKFTDTGWTPKFAILSGIVTEYGGILCHSAIVSREYGIPCIVSATGVMSKIKDGEIITINGTTGEIKRGE